MKQSKQENILKLFIRYVGFNVFGMIGLSCYILADTFFVAKGMGTVGLSALNLAIPIYSFINGTGLMLGIGGATRYSILKSRQEHEEANRVFTHVAVTGLCAGLLFLLLGIFGAGGLSYLLGADGQTYSYTHVYLKTVLCFSPMFIMNNIMICFVRNDGAPRLSMTAMLTGSFSNVILDYIFIFPMGMGMFGAAFATGLAPVISLALLSSYILAGKNKFKLVTCAFVPVKIGGICKLGLSSLITELSSGIVIIIFNMVILAELGNTGVAAYGIIANLALVAVAIFTGIAQGSQPLVSSNYGKGNLKNVKKVLGYAMISAVLFAAVLYLAVSLFPNQLVSAFNQNQDQELARIAVEGLKIYFAAFLFVGPNIVIAAFFSSIELPAQSFWISISRGCLIVIPMVFSLSALLGSTGTWLSFPMTEAVTAVISMGLLWRYLKK